MRTSVWSSPEILLPLFKSSRNTVTQRIQQERFEGTGILFNSQIPAGAMEQWCILEPAAEQLLKEAFEQFELTARGYYRIIRVARTIADMEGAEQIGRSHIQESLLFRRERQPNPLLYTIFSLPFQRFFRLFLRFFQICYFPLGRRRTNRAFSYSGKPSVSQS